MFAVGFAQTGLSRLTISLVSLVERWVIHKAKEGAVEANKYFAQLPTYTLKHVATALAHNSRATFSLSPIRSAELYAGLIGELNRRGLFGSSIRLIDSQLCNASSFLRVVDPSQQVVSDLLSQCAAANLANFFLQGKGDGRDLLVDAGEITQRTLLARLGRICALITHSDAPVVNAYQEILGNLRVRGWAEYDLSEYADQSSLGGPVVRAMREFYLSHPSCEQFFPRWLRLEEDIQNRSEEEASGFRLDGVSSDLSKVFNVRKIVPRPLELIRLGEWAIGSTHAEICIRVHSMRLSQDRRAIFGVLGIRATFDERCALACLEQLMQHYLLMHIYTLRKEPEFAVASAVESLRLAAKCTEVGQISRRNAYAEFLSRSAHNKNFAHRFDYWAPTQMLRKIAHFVSDHPHLREHPHARKFQGKVLEYNVAKSGISEQFVV